MGLESCYDIRSYGSESIKSTMMGQGIVKKFKKQIKTLQNSKFLTKNSNIQLKKLNFINPSKSTPKTLSFKNSSSK